MSTCQPSPRISVFTIKVQVLSTCQLSPRFSFLPLVLSFLWQLRFCLPVSQVLDLYFLLSFYVFLVVILCLHACRSIPPPLSLDSSVPCAFFPWQPLPFRPVIIVVWCTPSKTFSFILTFFAFLLYLPYQELKTLFRRESAADTFL